MTVERCTTCGNPTEPHPYRHPITRRQQPPHPMTVTTPIPEEPAVAETAPTTVVINNLPGQPFRELPAVVRESLTVHLNSFERSVQYHREQQAQFEARVDEHKAGAESAERQAHELRVYLAGGAEPSPAVREAQRRYSEVMADEFSTHDARQEAAEAVAAAMRGEQ